MKYRHAYHAGNFADVHKHVALLALLESLQRKDKGYFFLDTHAGRGHYSLSSGAARASGESQQGIEALVAAARQRELPPELTRFLELVSRWRSAHGPHDYPGSALIAAAALRAQDRGEAIEIQPEEFEALRRALGRDGPVEAAHGDGYERIRPALPPRERRGLVLIDPPYEDTRGEFRAAGQALTEALTRFETGLVLLWYPIKDARDTDRWMQELARHVTRPLLAAELWVHARDSRVGLNGSGLLVANPPYQFAQRCNVWQPALLEALGSGPSGGSRVATLVSEKG